MIMEARAKRLSTPLQWGRREKTAVGSLLAILLVALIAMGAYALTTGSPARADCVEVTFPSTLGAAKIHACGPRARVICANGDYYKGIAAQLSASCRHAGFPYIAHK
jgi:hypothetical protein